MFATLLNAALATARAPSAFKLANRSRIVARSVASCRLPESVPPPAPATHKTLMPAIQNRTMLSRAEIVFGFHRFTLRLIERE